MDEVHASIAALLIEVLLFLSSLETAATTASGDPDPGPIGQRPGREEDDPGGADSDPEPGRSPGCLARVNKLRS